MRLHSLLIALAAMSGGYTLAAGHGAPVAAALALWAVAAFTLAASGLVLGGFCWAVRRAAVHPGRPRPGLAEFNRYACVGAGAALGLLLLQAYAWARALPPPP